MKPVLALLAVVAVSGCTQWKDRVILMPDANGKVGKIAVLGDGKETVLDTAWASARTAEGGQVKPEAMTAERVQESYGAELAALPPRPVSFNLYFADNSDQLMQQSRERVPDILAEISRHPAAEVVVIGHTDTRADGAYNDQLSLARAKAVREQLVSFGLNPARITTAGRGERELAVPTADGVDEPRNRRVEINVR